MDVVREFWSTLEARDWDAFAALLAADVVITWPQSRERCRGRDALVRFMREFPGDWHLALEEAHEDATGGASRIAFTDGGRTQPGLSFFQLRDGLVREVVEFWPEPYEPPDRRGTTERY